METLRDKIGRWIPFAFWVFMTLISVISFIVFIYLVAKKIVVFGAILGLMGGLVNIFVYVIQSWGEWQEARRPSV